MRLAVLVVLALGGCDLLHGSEGAAPDDAGGGDAAPPRDDLVAPVGGPDTLDVACWNLEWFPKADATVSLVADLITSLELDVVVVEEVASVEAWDELVARLPEHAGVLSAHRYTPTSYQKIGVIYRTSLVTASDGELLFVTDTYGFPRPALLVHLAIDGGATIDLVGVHLKAGVGDDDARRRASGVVTLDAWMRAQIDGGGEDEIIVAGDYNEEIDPLAEEDVLTPLLAAPDRYAFRTADLAATDAASFLPYRSLIDHILTTEGLAAELGDRAAVIPDLAGMLPGYEANVSDHLPVVLSIPLD